MPDERRASTETILELVRLIHHASADSSGWPVFLEALVGALGARRGSLALRGVESHKFGGVCWYGWSDEEMQLYMERYAAIDVWGAGAKRLPEGFVGTDAELCPREETEASASFREFYNFYGCPHGMGGIILVTATGQSVVAAVRGAADGPFGEAEKAILRPLMPHLKLAAELHGELGVLRRQLATFTYHLNRYSHAFL